MDAVRRQTKALCRLEEIVFFVFCSCLLVTIFSRSPLFGQNAAAGGSVVGTVKDTSGAVVPQATVALTNKATGVALKTATTSAGQFVFPVVPIGRYSLAVSAHGFAQSIVNNIAVALSQTTTETVTLKVGPTTTSVRVTASTVHLDSTTSQLSTSLQNTYKSLPVEMSGTALSPEAMLDLMPGVSDGAPNFRLGPVFAQQFTASINGGQALGGEVIYDGAVQVQTNIAGDYRTQPIPVDALQEFSLVNDNLSAQYGRTPGGVLVFETKSGTSQLHGEAYEYVRNNAFDARGFFLPTTPVTRQNEFGFNMGGPVVLPKLYNGKGKTFFFAWYDGFRYAAGAVNTLGTIPTIAERNGDFSQYKTSRGQLIPIYNSLTTAPDGSGGFTRQVFQGNIIPQSDIIAQAKALLPYLPQPINSSIIDNALTAGTTTTDENRFGFKIDQNISAENIIHFTFGENYWNTPELSSIYQGPLNTGLLEGEHDVIIRLSNDYTFSPTIVNNFTVGYNRDNEPGFGPGAFAGLDTVMGLANTDPRGTAAFNWAGYASPTRTGGGSIIENGYDFNDFVAWVKGRHTIKFGADFEHGSDAIPQIPSETFSFSPNETDLPDAANPALTGNAFASFLTGAVDSANQTVPLYENQNRYSYLGVFVMDNFKVLPRLTLNLGLRYEIPWTRTDAFNILSSFDPNVPNPGAGGRLGALAFAGFGPGRIGSTRFDNVVYNRFQPRVGFAYAATRKTVIRGGFAVFNTPTGDSLDNGVRTQYTSGFDATPFLSSVNVGVTPAFFLQDGFPAFSRVPDLSPSLLNNESINYIAASNGHVGIIYNWTLDIQRQLPGQFLLDAAYVGNAGHDLGSDTFIPDQLNPEYLSLGSVLNEPLNSPAGQATGVALPYPGFTGTVAQALRPYPQYHDIAELNQANGISSYNAFQLKVQREFAHGLTVLMNYTVSKMLDNYDYVEDWLGGGPQNTYNLAAERSMAAINAPQVLALSYVYTLPFGRGQRFLSKPGVPRRVLGGWQVSGIQRYQAGFPLSVTIPNTLPLFNDGPLRPNVVLGVSPRAAFSGSFDPAKDVYVNENAFSIPAPFTLGNASRTLSDLRGFPYYDEDLAIARHFRLFERVDMEARVDAFNIFNRTWFAAPDTTGPYTNPDFGHVSGQANFPRSIQGLLRFTF